MLEKVSYDTIKKYKRYIPFDINNSSKLYFEKDLIHKIPYYVMPELGPTLEYIFESRISEIIELKKFIFNKENLVGYSFKNYKDYKSLRKINKRPLKLKLNDCIKIVNSFNTLSRNCIKYNDFHKGNVLLNEATGDIKICDIDNVSILIEEDFSKEQLKKSLILAFAYIYNVDFHDINILSKFDYVFNKGILIDKQGNFKDKDNTLELLQKLDLDMIPEERKKIKIKSKELSQTGYYLLDNF